MFAILMISRFIMIGNFQAKLPWCVWLRQLRPWHTGYSDDRQFPYCFFLLICALFCIVRLNQLPRRLVNLPLIHIWLWFFWNVLWLLFLEKLSNLIIPFFNEWPVISLFLWYELLIQGLIRAWRFILSATSVLGAICRWLMQTWISGSVDVLFGFRLIFPLW